MAANPYDPPQTQEPVMQEGANSFSFSWYRWFVSIVAKALLAPVSSTVPTVTNGLGIPGQIATDGTYLYVCVGVNSWKRTALAAW